MAHHPQTVPETTLIDISGPLLCRDNNAPANIRLSPPWPHDRSTVKELLTLDRTISLPQRHADAPAIPCQLRLLTDRDLNTLYSLHRLIVETLPHPHILRPDERDFMALHLDRRGRTFGAFIDGRLISYAALSLPGPDPDNLGRDIALPPDQILRVSHHEGSGVHPDIRGSNLHITLNTLRCQLASAAGYHHLMGTVSTQNPYSLRNHLTAGMVVRDIVIKYGGMPRLIIHRDLRQTGGVSTTGQSARERCRLNDIDRHRALLAAGLCGVAVSRDADGTFVLEYSPDAPILARAT